MNSDKQIKKKGVVMDGNNSNCIYKTECDDKMRVIPNTKQHVPGDNPSFEIHLPRLEKFTYKKLGVALNFESDKPGSSRSSRPPSGGASYSRRPGTPIPLTYLARPDSPHPNFEKIRPQRGTKSKIADAINNNEISEISEKIVKTEKFPKEIELSPSGKKHSSNKQERKVSFAPTVIMHERENKPPRKTTTKRALLPFGDRRLGFFIPPAAELIRCPSPIPNRLCDLATVGVAGVRVPFDRRIEENDYVRFTHIWRTPNMESRKNDDKCIVRLKRIHNIMTDLSDSHALYKYIPESIKTKFLQEEILPRYVMSLDLVLTESLLGVSIAIINTIRETVGFLHKMYYDEFFDEHHSPFSLPSVRDSGADYVDKVAPIIFTLNRISAEHARSNSSYMSKETACTKLLLELMALTVLPVTSVMFRCVLGIIPDTSKNCIKYLSQVEDESLLGWVNNSVMRREYMICLTKLSLADEFGAKAVLPALSLATIYAMSTNQRNKKDHPKHRSNVTTIGAASNNGTGRRQ